jgi:hypothetical protein
MSFPVTRRRQVKVLKPCAINGREHKAGDVLVEPVPVGPGTGRHRDERGQIWHRVPGGEAVREHRGIDIAGLTEQGLVKRIEDLEHAPEDHIAIDNFMLGLHGEIQPGQPVPATWNTPDGHLHLTDFESLVDRGLAKPAKGASR